MRFRLTAALVALAAVLSLSVPAAALEPGGPPNPLQAAIDAAVPGDTIDVPPGVYKGPIDFKGKDITLRSVDGPDATILDANFSQGVQIGPRGRLDGFTIRNAWGGFGGAVVTIGAGSVIANNRFDANQSAVGGYGAGVGGNGSSPVIVNNEFRHHTCDSQFLSGVVSFINSSSPRIANNLFAENSCRAVTMVLPVGNTPEVVNNTFVDNPVAIRVNAQVETGSHVYRNNVLVQNDIGLEVEALGPGRAPTFDHNLVWDNGDDYAGIADQTGIAGNISADPSFVAPAADNFRIARTSPAVDAGTAALAPSNDLDGTWRPLDADADGSPGYDMGVYEARPDGRFHPLEPSRLLDTREGNGAPQARVGSGQTLDLQIAGRGGVPASGAIAAAVNITAVDPTTGSHVTAWPTGAAMPPTSNLNLSPGRTVANAAQVGLGVGGQISLFNNAGEVDLVVDVVGWYDDGTGGGGRYTPVAPQRLVDSRIGVGGPPSRLGPGETRSIAVLGQGGVPQVSVSAVAVNVTGVAPTEDTFLTAWPSGGARPLASSVNPMRNEVAANFVVAGVRDGKIDIFNNRGSVDVVVDIVGWFDDGSVDVDGGFVPMRPNRVLDTRIGIGAPPLRMGPGSTLDVAVAGTAGVSSIGVRAVVVNITAVAPSSDSFLTAWPAGTARPLASNMNPAERRTTAGLAIVEVGEDGRISLYNNAGAVDVVVDVLGWYTGPLPT